MSSGPRRSLPPPLREADNTRLDRTCSEVDIGPAAATAAAVGRTSRQAETAMQMNSNWASPSHRLDQAQGFCGDLLGLVEDGDNY